MQFEMLRQLRRQRFEHQRISMWLGSAAMRGAAPRRSEQFFNASTPCSASRWHRTAGLLIPVIISELRNQRIDVFIYLYSFFVGRVFFRTNNQMFCNYCWLSRYSVFIYFVPADLYCRNNKKINLTQASSKTLII